MKSKRLFIVSPTNSGSSFLSLSLLQCEKVVGIPGVYSSESCLLPEAKKWGIRGPQLKRTGRTGDNYDIDVFRDSLEEIWQRNDKYKKEDRVLLEKSPGYNVFIAQKIDKVFDNPYFILLMRHPFAFLEGVKRRENDATRSNLQRIMDFWKQCAYKQIQNYEVLEFSLAVTYEVMCDFPRQIENAIRDYLRPLAGDFALSHRIRCGSIEHKGNVEEGIRNYNHLQKQNLTEGELDFVRDQLRNDQEALSFFDYKLE